MECARFVEIFRLIQKQSDYILFHFFFHFHRMYLLKEKIPKYELKIIFVFFFFLEKKSIKQKKNKNNNSSFVSLSTYMNEKMALLNFFLSKSLKLLFGCINTNSTYKKLLVLQQLSC